MWVIFISPYESQESIWTMKQFNSEQEALDYAKNADLTKEHYICPVDELVSLLRDKFDETPEIDDLIIGENLAPDYIKRLQYPHSN